MTIIILLIAIGALVFFAYRYPDVRTKVMAAIAALVAAGAALWDQIVALWS